MYFRERKYVSNSNRFRLRIIQLTHDNIVDEHSKRVKCYELINWAYWWLNIYKFIQCFVRNCHVCTRFKFSRQRIQSWLRSLLVFERRWRDVFMNYIDFLSSNIFISVIYRYILVFVDHFIKMRHLVLIVSMKIKEVINFFYVHVWKYYDLSKFFVFNKYT